MEEKEQGKKNYKRIVIGLVVIIAIVLGVSYAWLTVVVYGDKGVSIIAAGSLSLELDESMTEGIKIEKAIPITDEEGKEQVGYTFSLENQGDIDSDYTIYLDDIELSAGQERMKDSHLKYQLIRDGEEKKLELLSETGENPNRVLETGEIAAGEKYHYTLKIWIDYDAPNEAMGKVFKGKLRIEATQKIGGVNKPRMDSNMLRVVYNEASSTWEKAREEDWYDYDAGKWANAVTVTSASRSKYQSAAVGTAIAMDDIETMWVWIPRYSYTIGSEDGTNYYGKKGEYLTTAPTKTLPGEIDVKFITKDVKETGSGKYKVVEGVNNWRTPDAFTFGDEELSGVWVGKFETSSSNPTAEYGGGNVTNLDAMIKPNVTSWRSIQVANIAEVGRNITKNGNRYGFGSDKLNSHAMKNSEWALASYLSQSKYGKLGNKNYSGANKEIYQNKSNQFITGCSYGSPSNANTDYGCQYSYDVSLSGTGASTTGTIYGIYDMSGGTREYMMGDYAPGGERHSGKSISEHSGYAGLLQDGTKVTGKDFLEDKYYDFYESSDPLTACNGKACVSQALNETSGWYGDYTYMITSQYPWTVRGGVYGDDSVAGVFFYDNTIGYSNNNGSFRLVLSAT